MLNGRSVVAIIPAKAHSQRVPDKNLRPLDGIPLVVRKILQLKASKLVDTIVVGSNSDRVRELSLAQGAEYLHREPYFCDEDACSANEMIEDLVSRVQGDIILWAHCTNPFVEARDYDAALEAFHHSVEHDSLMSVTALQSHIWTADGKPLNFQPLRRPHQLASTLEPIYFQDGAIFIQPRLQMAQNAYFYGHKPIMHELPALKSIDINTADDFLLAEILAERLREV